MKTCQYKIRVTNQVEGEAEIMLYGTIGEDFFAMEESITAKKFVSTLADLKNIKKITLRINSGGGSVFDAQAIYNALVRHPARVTAYIDGIAASAASWIAMAGDEILMAENGLFMYHLSQGMTMGDRHEHAKAIEIFDKIDGIIAGTYAKRTGKNAAELLEQMKNETWLTASEAKEAGFVSGIIESKGQPVACVGPECAKLYNHAPEKARLFFRKVSNMSAKNGCKCGGGNVANAASQECIDAKVAEGMTLEEATAACEAESATETPAPENAGPAYEEGCQVAMSQGAASTNPYESGTKEWEDWQAGFESCGAGNSTDEPVYGCKCNNCGADFNGDTIPSKCPACGSRDFECSEDGIGDAASAKPSNEMITCPFCDGTGICDHCDGEAVMPDGSDCPECKDGSCIVCEGTGTVENEAKVKPVNVTNSAAYDEGFDAGIEGESAASNPYDKEPEKSEWLDGWADGFASNGPGDKSKVKPKNAVAARLAKIQKDEVENRLAMLV